MDHDNIVELVRSMKIQELTEDTFPEFVQNAEGLFVPSGARFQEFYSPGINTLSSLQFDFSKGKPEYRLSKYPQDLIFDRIEYSIIPSEGKKWINVHFKNEDKYPGIWGIGKHKKLPMKFGFRADKAIYLADQEGSGTVDMPYERVYIKLDLKLD